MVANLVVYDSCIVVCYKGNTVLEMQHTSSIEPVGCNRFPLPIMLYIHFILYSP